MHDKPKQHHFSRGPKTTRDLEELAKQPYLTLHEAGLLLRVSPWTVRKYIRDGTLECIRIGRRIIMKREQIERFIIRHTTTAAAPLRA